MTTEATKTRKPSLRINAISNWVVLALNILTGFFLTPFIIRHLGESGYGIWTLVCSFIGYYGLLNLGVSSAIQRFIARDSARQDGQALNRVGSTALAIFTVTGLLVLLVSFLLSGLLADFFHVNPESRQGFIRLVWLIGMTTTVGFPVEVLAAIVIAREHYVALNIANAVRISVRVILTIILLKAGYGLIGVGLAPLAAAIVFGVMAVFFFRKYAADICLSPANVHRGTLRKLISFGGVTTIMTIASLLRIELDSVVIGRMIGLAQVGYYGIAALIIRYIMRVIISMTGVLTPRFAALDGAEQHEALQRLFLRATRITSLMTFFICGHAYLFGERFIEIWVKNPEYAVAVPVLHILLIGWCLTLCQNPGLGLMYALNRHRLFAAVLVCEAFANVALSIYLAGRIGLKGVAIGTMIPMVVTNVIIRPVLISRIAKIGLWQYASAILPGMLIGAVMVVFIHLLRLQAYLRVCSLMSAALVVVGSVTVIGGICFTCWRMLERKQNHAAC
ncbi:MAG: oligosaccharide flippase family protein [Planctomycetota bacterium]|jgi:O-antigen/teichoic acid export membrane protein